MYFGGIVVDKASTVGIEISPTPSPNFHGDQKVQNLASFSTSLANHSTLSRPHFKKGARYPNSKMLRLSPYVLAKFSYAFKGSLW